MTSEKYFANCQGQELLDKLNDKVQEFYRHLESTGQAKKWRKAFDLYYGDHIDDGESGQTNQVGEDSELTAYGVNYFRNLARHVLALTCSQKPAYDFRAINSDLKSQQQARLANNIIDAYLVEKRLGRHQKQAAEKGLVFGVGYTYTTWNPALGNQFGVEQRETDGGEITEKIIYEGDAEISAPSPWNVVYDIYLRDWAKTKWALVKEYENKYDLAARHPEHAEKILSFSPESEETDKVFQKFTHMDYLGEEGKNDLIPVWHFYHLPTDSVPQGKYSKFIGDDILLYEGAYQYKKKLPVQRITPGEKFDSAQGFTELMDIMALQTVLNVLYSTVFTNQKAFGVQSIWLPEGCNISSDQIGDGLVVLKGGLPGTEPKPLQLTATPGEVFKNMD
jgi:hypothetical protein